MDGNVLLMTSEDNKELARRYFKAYETEDIDTVMKFIGSGYVLHPGAGGEPMNAEQRKRDETVFFSAFSNIQVTVEDQIAEADKIANRITMQCTHSGEYQGVPASGKRVIIPYIDILHIESAKIVEEWVEFDVLSILRQIKGNTA